MSEAKASICCLQLYVLCQEYLVLKYDCVARSACDGHIVIGLHLLAFAHPQQTVLIGEQVGIQTRSAQFVLCTFLVFFWRLSSIHK